MADGLFNLCGRRTTTLTKDGKTYRVCVKPLTYYASKEDAILSRVGNPYAGIESIKDARAQLAAMKCAADATARPLIATVVDEDNFDRSHKGIAWSIWRGMGDNHANEFPQDIPHEQGIELGLKFISWFNDIGAIIRAIHFMEEKNEVGNSNGPAEATVPGQ